MAEYATWKPLEKPSRKEGFRQTVHSSLNIHTIAMTIPALIASGALILHRDSALWERGLGVLLLLAIFYSLRHPVDLFKPSLKLKELSENDKSGGFHHAVKLTIFKNEKIIGQDEGIVRFEQGMLLYRGLRTEFSLSRSDVDAPIEGFANGPLIRAKDWRLGNLVDDSAWGFLLAEDPSIRLNFFPQEFGRSTSIYGPLRQWLQSNQPGQMQTLLPPTSPCHP